MAFKEVVLTWGGEEYAVKPEKVLGLIDAIEETGCYLEVVNDFFVNGKVKRAKIAQGYAAALTYAGAKVSHDDVYYSLFEAGKAQANVAVALHGLLMMMIPPPELQEKLEKKSTNSKKAVAKG